MTSQVTPQEQDYPLSPVPMDQRRSIWSMGLVLLGFTFFTATMWAGGSIGVAFDFSTMLLVLAAGNLLLGTYAAILGYIAAKSGLNTALMSRFTFGELGSKLSDFILGFTQIGWYAWGTATMAVLLVKLTGLPESWTTPLMVVFGFGFCITAFIGYKGLEMLSRFAVPAMIILVAVSMTIATSDAGGFSGLLAITPSDEMTVAAAITMVFGTFVSGGTQATNWTRFAKSGKTAVIATLLAFFLGNGLMTLIGAFGALVYQQADIVDIMVAQGLATLGILMLFLNLWTTQDNTVYNFAVAGCNMIRTRRRKLVTVGGAAIGTVLAVLGMYEWLIPFLVLLGTFIPPIGGVIMASYFIGYKREYPSLETATLPAFNVPGLAAYAIGSAAAYTSPWIAPIVGVLVAAASYGVVLVVSEAVRDRRAQVLGAV
ncbi:cytosine permease [uncultured Marinobacter sp.]|jgi:cytosine permease|uniref:Cytosine permease n=1 Tax=Marinobacter adhaerens TaxID=1033846 RepID=A0A359C5I1_9GAMM|nr:cytosine permease [uncultured Marinobacter sp.]MBQ92893.1 cytosine permease [Marinobacter sp.]HBC34877.1 cytosine permease [Marinobacter adhaerens]MCW9007256.1 cytosine permease [Marinobacter sp.]HBX41699.1 cytosine permease [Marinobacter adhaerens]HCA10476.1 cytosine permease [Marinobacter adhaerens]|tara:strand:- start:7700 stop:8983 length:1284 start_codon:yes stop_codon:yes gene_type:complete